MLDIKSGLYRRLTESRRWLRKQVLRAKKAPVIHCIGDSHMHVMEYVASNGMLSATRLEFCIIDGATISGLPNPNSKTQAGPIIQQYMHTIKPNDHVFLCFGEVDCGYIIWYRSQKYKESIVIHLENTVRNYCELIRQLNRLAPNQVIVCSIPPPTIRDENEWGKVANARSEVKASQLERTNLTQEMNERMHTFCQLSEINFINLDDKLIDEVTGVIKEQYLNKNPLDHHLNEEMYGRLIVDELTVWGFI